MNNFGKTLSFLFLSFLAENGGDISEGLKAKPEYLKHSRL